MKEENAKQINSKRRVVSPKQSNTFDETVEELKRKIQTRQDAQAKKKFSPTKAKPQSQAVYQTSKEILVQEKQPTYIEEGNSAEPEYERPLTAEEILHNERMKAAQSVKLDNITEDNYGYELNVREAFIGSIIFERRI